MEELCKVIGGKWSEGRICPVIKDPGYFTWSTLCLDWITSASKFLCPKREINGRSLEDGGGAHRSPGAMISGAGSWFLGKMFIKGALIST